MNFLKAIFGQSDPIKSNQEFWDWFKRHAKGFFQIVKDDEDIEEVFFKKLSPRLNELNEGFYYLTGMLNDDTVELIFTAEGSVKHIVFVEELVASAPHIPGWKFTALKPAMDIRNVYIDMDGYKFTRENIFFYSNDDPRFPDEIDITFVHNDMTELNQKTILQGTYIFLDNFLGELNFATDIDSIKIIGKRDATSELVPIEKLPHFLAWRKKEFVEKYDGIRHRTDADQYAVLQGTLEDESPVLAVVNTDLLEWDRKASHPWILTIEIKYDGKANAGLPDKDDFAVLSDIENELMNSLKDDEGYLNIGRHSAKNLREIYFACKDFRIPSKVAHEVAMRHGNRFEINYHLYKDKYWKSFDRFRQQY